MVVRSLTGENYFRLENFHNFSLFKNFSLHHKIFSKIYSYNLSQQITLNYYANAI